MPTNLKKSYLVSIVTGAAGFIGSHLCEFLLGQGHFVIGIDNFITGDESNLENLKADERFSFICQDVCGEPLAKELKARKADFIFHLASPASPEKYKAYPFETLWVNSVGLKNMLELCCEFNAKLVFSSTSEVYGDPLEHPQKESYFGNVNSFGPRSCYDEAKRFGEALCYSYWTKRTANISIARIFNSYGPRMSLDDGRVIPNFIKNALTNKELVIYGDGLQTRSLCYVDDLVEGIYLLAKSKENGVINLGNPHEITIRDLADHIIKITQSRSKIIFADKTPDDPQRRCPDINKAKSLLGWEPQVDLNNGLSKTVSYFRKILGF